MTSNVQKNTLCGISISVCLLMVSAGGLAQEKLAGKVKVDGSSTVGPISQAAAEMFQKENSAVRVTVGISGTGGGFKKFLDADPSLRTDISDASRHIKPSEIELAAKGGVEYIELPIGIDGLAVIVNPKNTFCDHLTVEELKKIWQPESNINNWKDVRAGFPDLPLKLYGPGTDSGTFDYFTEAIVGKEKASRSDYTASENDNVLVQGVEGNNGALGYFGYSYYEGNKKKLKLLAIDSGKGPVTPSPETVHNGTYKPLSRPLFLYVNKASLERPEVRAFLDYYLTNAKKIVEHPTVNYVALDEKLYAAAKNRLAGKTTGTVYSDKGADEKTLAELYGAK